jgi:hypothetical protein
MLTSGFTFAARVLGAVALGLASLPAVAGAEGDMMRRVERTPTYEVVLSIGPADMASESMAMSQGHSSDMSMSMGQGHSADSSMSNMASGLDEADQGMAVNHQLDLHITRAGSGAVVSDLTPVIRITDKATGESHDLPAVMGMNGGMGADDFHYVQNVFLADGTYQVSVLLGPGETAQFRDLTLVATPSMGSGMADSHGMGMQDQHPTQP